MFSLLLFEPWLLDGSLNWKHLQSKHMSLYSLKRIVHQSSLGVFLQTRKHVCHRRFVSEMLSLLVFCFC